MALTQREVDPNKVAVYIRWSTDDQSQGTTLETQMEGCRHYVLSQGWQVRDDLIFIDDGYSGGNINRPALSRLRKAVKQGKVDCIVVFKLDRLSRSVVDTVKLVLEEWEGRAYIKSAREPIDTSTPHGKVLFYILASYAEWERSVIRERTHSGQLKRAQAGRNPGFAPPYGYAVGETPGTLAVVPIEAEIVRRIFRMYVEGAGAKTIVDKLNGEGVPFRHGRSWNQQTVLHILKNPVYCGELVYGRITKNPRYGKEPGERFWLSRDEVIRVTDTPHVPAIVERELFLETQEARKARAGEYQRRFGRANSAPNLLTGVARCRCGYGLYKMNKGKNGRGYHYYACRGKKMRGASFCEAANIPQATLDKLVAGMLVERYGGEVRREEYVGKSLQVADRELAEVSARVQAVQQELSRLERQLQKVRRDYREERLTPEDFRQLQVEIDGEIEEARQQLRALEVEQEQVMARKGRVALLRERLAQVDLWGSLGIEEQKNLVKALVRSLVVYRTGQGQEVHVDVEWAE